MQRTLKFCRHLPEFGVEVDVLAPSDPKWFARDEPLMAAIPAETTVHRARFLGPSRHPTPTPCVTTPVWAAPRCRHG